MMMVEKGDDDSEDHDRSDPFHVADVVMRWEDTTPGDEAITFFTAGQTTTEVSDSL